MPLLSNVLPVNFDGRYIYDIVYAMDFTNLTEYLHKFNPARDKKLCIVSDSKVSELYIEKLKAICGHDFTKIVTFVFHEGEESKNLDTIKELYIMLIEEHFDRSDLMIALGGGVTGDMCGYAAATYLRGIDYIQIPTSLLADVDSSIGGKTGVDFDQYKNMVGAFHMPKLVYINLSTLTTLDKRQFWSGMGEVVKSALIKDEEFYYYLKENIDALKSISSDDELLDYDILKEIILRSNMIKRSVVEEDPHETKGERALLNYGHTLGHAIERFMNFELLHGECVAIGCILAAYISRDKGLLSIEETKDIESFIRNNFDLPELKLSEEDMDEIIEITHSDKKMSGDIIKFILLNKIGNAVINTEVSEYEMKEALKEYCNC